MQLKFTQKAQNKYTCKKCNFQKQLEKSSQERTERYIPYSHPCQPHATHMHTYMHTHTNLAENNQTVFEILFSTTMYDYILYN